MNLFYIMVMPALNEVWVDVSLTFNDWGCLVNAVHSYQFEASRKNSVILVMAMVFTRLEHNLKEGVMLRLKQKCDI